MPVKSTERNLKSWPLFLGSIFLLASYQALALTHAVNDFRDDYSGLAADTTRISPTFGDTLGLSVQRREYRTIGIKVLTDGTNINGLAGSQSMAAARGPGQFEFGYVSWKTSHASTTNTTLPGDVRVRQAFITDDSAGFATNSRIIAENEMPVTVGNRAPSHLWFDALGSRYVAYWSSLDNRGLRRTTDLDTIGNPLPTAWADTVTPTSPVTMQAYGTMSGSVVPGSSLRKTISAYTSQVGGASSTIELLWEDLALNSSARTTFTRPDPPEDFSVASDSAGSVVVLWREAAVMYYAAFKPDRSVLQAPTLISGIHHNDNPGILKFYRPFQVTAIANNQFQFVYARSNIVYTRRITLNANSATVAAQEILVSTPGQVSFYPSLASNGSQIAIAYFHRLGAMPSNNHKVKSVIYTLNNGQVDTASKFSYDVAPNDSVGFTEVASSWSPYHNFQTASVALDALGNFGVGYADGYHAKAALVKFAALYSDSGTFTSKTLQVGNSATGLTFDANSDSVEYRPPSLTGNAGATVRLAVSRDGQFTAPADSFRTVTTAFKTQAGRFRYRVRLVPLDTSKLFSGRLTSLSLPYQVKPRAPVIDSVRFANRPWRPYQANDTSTLIRRLDSVQLAFTGRDFDDGDSLQWTVRLGARILASGTTGSKRSPGHYLFAPRIAAPDTQATSVTLKATVTDGEGWISNAGDVNLRLANALPSTSTSLLRHRGLDSAGSFYSSRGLFDTLTVRASDTVWVHAGDTAQLRVSASDLNDDSLTFSLTKTGSPALTRKIARGLTTVFSLTPPTTQGAVDTYTLVTSDPDTALSLVFRLIGNSPPRLDSLRLQTYVLRDGTRRSDGGTLASFSGNPSISMPAQVSATLKAYARDLDGASGGAGSGITYRMQHWRRPNGCALGNRTCLTLITTSNADTLPVVVQATDDQISLRATDARGAFTESLIRLHYSLADTSSATPFKAQILQLDTALDFVMLSGIAEKTVNASLRSQGSQPLQIVSAITSRNQAKHLSITLTWRDSAGATQTLGFTRGTHIDPMAGNSGAPPPRIPSGNDLALQFRFFTDSLKGDTIFTDTLVLRTNDLSAPVLRIPFRLINRELPVLNRLGPLTLGQSNRAAPSLALDEGIRFVFSEPVLVPASGFLTVYSLLDSLANPRGYAPIPGTLIRRRALNKIAATSQAFKLSLALAKLGAAADSLVDTVIFMPQYTRASDSLKARPRPGYFLPRDILRIRLSNTVTDAMGNALDLRRERIKRAAGTLDTVLTLHTDTLVLRIVRSTPAQGDTEVSPDASVRLTFNRPLAVRAPPPGGLDVVDLETLDGDANPFFTWESAKTGRKPLDFASLTLLPGDTVLVIRPRERVTAFDSVTLRVSGSLSDTDGNTLDGNEDGFPGYLFNPAAGVDDFVLTYTTGEAGFYVFPNPYRFDNVRHRNKGSVTFKNLNSLPGYAENKSMTLRIHDMAGGLVYNHDRHASSSERRGAALFDWNLKNDFGVTVATGVFLYSLTDASGRLLIKGKLAVIR